MVEKSEFQIGDRVFTICGYHATVIEVGKRNSSDVVTLQLLEDGRQVKRHVDHVFLDHGFLKT